MKFATFVAFGRVPTRSPTYAYYFLSATPYLLDCTLLYCHALQIARHTLNDNRRRRCSTFPKAVGPRRRLEVPG